MPIHIGKIAAKAKFYVVLHVYVLLISLLHCTKVRLLIMLPMRNFNAPAFKSLRLVSQIVFTMVDVSSTLSKTISSIL